jgi:transketolase C-terminal domain/subunit
VDAFADFYQRLDRRPEGDRIQEELLETARRMHIGIETGRAGAMTVAPIVGPVLTKRAPRRDKQIRYDPALLPKIDRSKEYNASDIVTAAMKVFARDSRVVSIDADLASTSGLEAGVGAVDQKRALNVGVAEANMMNLGEAFAALGCNTWVSTFCPFFDWKVMRRISVGHQERLEAIDLADGWLGEGHGLDLTLLATAPNFETRTNGATHMGNDDVTVFDGMAHLKIIDVSCPQQLVAIMKWIMAGNRGMTYVRVMRAPSGVLYDGDFEFAFGKGYILRQSAGDAAVIVSSGRGVHEALAAAAECAGSGIGVGVVDMPSIDDQLLLDLYRSGKLICFAEQNNGYILQNFLKVLYRHRSEIAGGDLSRVISLNALDANGRPRFIHSGMYEELLAAFALAPAQIVRAIKERVSARA